MSEETDSILSVGIDIGTTTTHLTLSRLLLQNEATANQVPRISVLDRQILYKSPIHRTPLSADGSIDAQAVAALISREYSSSSFSSVDIKTGAVIITGESARKRNAREVSQAISELAGEFVVASAGAQLECLLAGRGAAAESDSRSSGKTICNIDIGGGTSNLAVFRNGELLEAACLGIGGRCIQFDKEGAVTGFTDSGEDFLNGVAKYHLFPLGLKPDLELVQLVGALVAELILHTVTSKSLPQLVRRLMLTEGLSLNYHIDEFRFSGGVAECMRAKTNSLFEFGDMGVAIASGLLDALAEKQINFRIAEAAIRSTVIGAGMYSMQLSGCTVMVTEGILPLRNVRILSPFAATDGNLDENTIFVKLRDCLESCGARNESLPVAIAVCDISALSYDALQKWARALLKSYKQAGWKFPLIILSKTDIAMALGQTIKKYAPEIEQIILDGVDTSPGDLIDIGNSLPARNSVPLTVKTLIFER